MPQIESHRPVHITPRGLFCAFLIVAFLLLIAGTVQTICVFRRDCLQLAAEQNALYERASALLDEAERMNQEARP